MGNSGHNETDGTGLDESRLRQFERNRFFNGKLMTARDMQAEQNYHAGRFDTLTQHVTGEGIVCGLEVEIEPAEGTGDTPTAVVSPGLAFDSSGRPIVVADDTPEEIPSEKLGGNGVSVFIEHATCKTESVPVPGSEDACKEECDYNRLRETVDITFERGPPGEQKSVPIDRVDTIPPDGDDFLPDETEGETITPTDDVLHELARTYNLPREEDPEELRYRPCNTAGDGAVFTGYFKEQDDGSWSLDEDSDDSEPRPYVYTNDMLYAGLADHAFAFENPHYTSLEVSNRDNGATVGIERTKDVTLTSSDESVSITATANDDEKKLDFTDVGGGGLGPLEAYLREHAVRCTACTFAEVEDQFEQSPSEAATHAGNIAKAARGELDATPPPENFPDFVESELRSDMDNLDDELQDLDFVGGREDYKRGLGRLGDAIDDGDPVKVSIALLRMCEVAGCLSGHCIGFDKFHKTNSLVTSPLTYRELVFIPKFQDEPDEWDNFEWENFPRFVTTEDDTTALRFDWIQIAVPMTSTATVTIRKKTAMTIREETANTRVYLLAYGEGNGIIDWDWGDTSSESSLTLSIDSGEDSISYLELYLTASSDSEPSTIDDARRDILGNSMTAAIQPVEIWADLTRICVE